MKRSGQRSLRRRFMQQAVLSAGATATLGKGVASMSAAEEGDISPITMPASEPR